MSQVTAHFLQTALTNGDSVEMVVLFKVVEPRRAVIQCIFLCEPVANWSAVIFNRRSIERVVGEALDRLVKVLWRVVCGRRAAGD